MKDRLDERIFGVVVRPTGCTILGAYRDTSEVKVVR